MKTNLKRISKRSLALILGILMLFSTLMVGTITASAYNYDCIKGTWDDWNPHDISSGTYKVTLTSGTKYQFELYCKDNGQKFTYDTTITSSVTDLQLNTQDKNMYIEPSVTGEYTFTFNSSTQKLSVTFPGGSIGGGDTHTVYFKNTVDWSNVWVHLYSAEYWNSDSGTGCQNIAVVAEKMTLVDGTTDIYSYEYTGDYNYISFTEEEQRGFQYFSNTKAAYRGDLNTAMSTGTPMYVPSTTSSGTYSNTVYYSNGEWQVLQIGDTVTPISAPTEDKKTNTIIANTSTRAQSIWIWGDGVGGKAYNLKEVDTVSTQYLSYHSYSMSNPSAIFVQGTVDTDGSESFPGGAKISTEDVKSTNELTTSVDGHTSVIDGNYYYPVTGTTTTTANFTVFDHIGGTITPDKTEITTGQSIKLTGAATAGTLRKSKIGNVGSDKFTYVVRDSGGKYYRIGDDKTELTSVTWTPTVGGTYTVCGLVTDPFGFESIKVAETTVTVNDPVQQKYTVTYSAGANGSMTCAQDTVNVESGSQVVADTNVTFTISPDEGYEVDTFTVNGEDKKSSITNNTYTHTVQADVDVLVTFKKTTYNVTVDSGITGGTVTPSANTANMGDNITLTVEPNMGYFLKSVTVTKASGGTITCTNNSFTMPAENVTISATFVSYRITGSLTTAGTSVDKDTTWDKFDNGMAFDTKVSDTVYSKTITLVESDFTNDNQRNKFRLMDNGGTVYSCKNSDSELSSNGHYRYLITKNDSESNSYTTVNGTTDNYFYFDAVGEYTLYIKYVAGGNPRIWVEKGAFSLTSDTTRCDVNFYRDADLKNEITQSKANQTVYVKVTPNTYCEVKNVIANNGVTLTPVSGKENVYSFTMPNSDVNVTATAETIKQTVTFSFSNASLTVNYFINGNPYNNVSVNNGGTVTVDKGTTLGVSARLDSGYEATTTPWTIDPAPGTTLTTTSTTCSFTVSADTAVTYNTKKIQYNISYENNPSKGGTSVVKIGDAEVTTLSIGDKFTVDQTVNTVGGYEIASVQVTAGGSALNPDTNGIYTMATGDVTVTTTYKAIKPTISNCPTETVTLYAGESYTIPAKTDYGALSYSAEPDGELIFNEAVVTAPNHTGDYVVTITATNQPEGITTAATTTATFNITVVLTETQKAYNELKAVYDEIGHEKEIYYESNEAWTAYENAVDNATTLLATFPSYTATDTKTYTDAKTALQNAYDEIQKHKKVTTIYVLSQYSDYVNLHMFTFSEVFEPVGEVTEISTNSESKAYAMTKLGKVKKDNSDKYLYKFEYFGTADFVVYVGDSTNKVIGDNNKLTCDVKCCDDITSYYFDLQNVESGNKVGDYSIDDIVSPYAPLSVELTQTSDTCVEDTVYDLTTNIPKTLGGTLYSKSGVTVTHTYTYKLNDKEVVISNPATWVPAEPGIYTITVTSSNGITTENVENTFMLYVKDKLDKPILYINSVSTGNITVNDKTNVVLEVTSSGVDYPEGVKYIFTVDDKTYESDTPKYTFKAQTPNALGIGTHSVSVKVVAPDTIFPGTEYAKYVNSDSSDTRTVTVETVKYTYSFDFTNCHVTVSVAYELDGEPKTFTDLKGDIKADKESTVTFTVTMKDNYVPIPQADCWSGVEGATIGNDKLSYSFTATESNADSTVVFKSYLPVSITPTTQNIKIGDSAEITIVGIDSNASYELQYKKVGDTEYKVANSADLADNKFTTQSLEYGNYQFIVRQTVHGYDFTSNEVSVNAVIGTVVLKYYYREYNTNNGIAYDPYIGIENNLRGTATEYSVNLDRDISTIIDADGNFNDSKCVELYKQYAPNIISNYFDYTLDTSDMNYSLSTDKKTCTIKCEAAMTPSEIVYKVKVNGEIKIKSYYQQKTFLLDAVDYCTGEAPNGYMWYYEKGDSIEIVSTDRYYKLRVARDTDLLVAVIENPSINKVTTIINEPVYTEFTNETNAVKVKINMLVENYLPEGAVRTRTGVVYYSYVGDNAPTIDSSELPALIENSTALQNVSAGVTCKVGTTSSNVEIKGYYTNSDNVNGKFIFAPIADINSKNIYVVYSYLTYTIDNESYTVISANPVTASVQEYKAQNSTQTS